MSSKLSMLGMVFMLTSIFEAIQVRSAYNAIPFIIGASAYAIGATMESDQRKK